MLVILYDVRCEYTKYSGINKRIDDMVEGRVEEEMDELCLEENLNENSLGGEKNK